MTAPSPVGEFPNPVNHGVAHLIAELASNDP
eukprot:CAMPEP_0180552710 /NCGR_PEP_ID=MMETSP1036_2-20121128/73874_1 /TAXON_ID=632150 /ORGANISM="Azadinium spinosum, Strain 3D9" /LENGTH=30 /DNA_ID= /DNA_START= /DNA_END= /DNA_ORIENTATION=